MSKIDQVSFERVPLEQGPYEYPGFIPLHKVESLYRLSTGNLVVMDHEGHLFDVHPLTTSRFNKNIASNESCERCYPIRWQLMKWDVPEELTEKLS